MNTRLTICLGIFLSILLALPAIPAFALEERSRIDENERFEGESTVLPPETTSDNPIDTPDDSPNTADQADPLHVQDDTDCPDASAAASHETSLEAAETIIKEKQLEDAIKAAPNYTPTTLEIGCSFDLTSAYEIPSTKDIHLTSSPGAVYTLNGMGPNADRHFIVKGKLTISRITLDGLASKGGILVENGSLTVEEQATIKNCVNIIGTSARDNAGGVTVKSGTLTMFGGTIKNCRGTNAGAVSIIDGTFDMQGGIIGGDSVADANYSEDKGDNLGGVLLKGSSHLIMSGKAKISHNRGSGVRVSMPNTGGESASVTLKGDAEISYNGQASAPLQFTSPAEGGGVRINGEPDGPAPSFSMEDTSRIIGNTAANNGKGVGGGIYSSYANIAIEGHAEIANNTSDNDAGIHASYGTFSLGGSARVADNRTAEQGSCGGVRLLGTASATIRESASISNNSSYSDAGVFLSEGQLLMSGGTISNNSAQVGGGGLTMKGSARATISGNALVAQNSGATGGGVYVDSQMKMVDETVLTMNGGTIRDNTAEEGGGVYLRGGTAVVNGTGASEGAKIINNTASKNGGGLFAQGYFWQTSTSQGSSHARIDINNGLVQGNEASNKNGGGIYHDGEYATLKVTNGSRITDNDAPLGHGGGIYTTAQEPIKEPIEEPIKEPITVNDATIFENNSASIAYWPPDNVDIAFPHIKSSTCSIPVGHALNNYDVSFDGTRQAIPHKVAYHANDGTGTVLPATAYYEGEIVTIENPSGLSRDGYDFTGWNSSPDGTGEYHAVGKTFTMPDQDVDIYAIWKKTDAQTTSPDTPGQTKPTSSPSPKLAKTGDDCTRWVFLLGFACVASMGVLAVARRKESR